MGSVYPGGVAGGGTGIAAGMIGYFAQATPPTGWLKANGAALSRTTYAALFAAIGTTHGVGDGSTTFNLPDLRGEFVRGWDDGAGVDPGRTLGSAQLDAFEDHEHGTSGQLLENSGTSGMPGTSGRISAPVTVTITGANSGRTATETRPRNVALLGCIKY